MGISVAMTPSTVSISKSMITNASFRTKKLPGKLIASNLPRVQPSNNNKDRNECDTKKMQQCAYRSMYSALHLCAQVEPPHISQRHTELVLHSSVSGIIYFAIRFNFKQSIESIEK